MSSADFAAVFNQHMSGLESLAKGIAGPRFVPPQQPHQFQVLGSSWRVTFISQILANTALYLHFLVQETAVLQSY